MVAEVSFVTENTMHGNTLRDTVVGVIERPMTEISMDVGYIYVLTNSAMPGLVKIGRSTDVNRRVKELSVATGVPDAFVVELFHLTAAVSEVESLVHDALNEHRYKENREFFAISPSKAISTIRKYVREPPTRFERTPPQEAVETPKWECRRCGFGYNRSEQRFCPKCDF